MGPGPDGIAVEIDVARGVVRSIRDPMEQGGANYLADNSVTYRSELGAEELFLGDVVVRTWEGGSWALRSTSRSGCTRTVTRQEDGQGCVVEYPAGATGAGGLGDLAIEEAFLEEDAAFLWRLRLTNASSLPLEIGELSLPFPLNNDLAELFRDQPPAARSSGELQRVWHEEKALAHLHVAGHSSYLLAQRPSGNGRLLCVVPTGNTAIEVAYQVDPALANQWSEVFEATYFLTVHSRAAREVNGWLANRQSQSRWLLGASSRVLEPGEEYQLGFRFKFIAGVEQLREELLGEGNVHVDAAPGYVVPIGHEVQLAVSSTTPPALRSESDAVRIGPGVEHEDHRYLYRIEFGTLGQKVVRVDYGAGRSTKVALFVTELPRPLLERRASFICARQFYQNPDDEFGRHHAFMPYDDDVRAVYIDSEESWQVGASDEYGLPVAMFLAEKNAHSPVPAQVARLEEYVDTFVFERLQDRGSLEIRRGLAFGPEFPSRQPHEWTRQRAFNTHRFNNYPLLANVYHALSKIGRRYGLTRSRSSEDYLALAWKTAIRGFEVGIRGGNTPPHIGAPAGANLIDLLIDCRERDTAGYQALEPVLRRFAEESAKSQYPFGSELYIDQTAHDQVYVTSEEFGDDDLMERTVSAVKALRGGFQPYWFRYGNDQRGSVCLFYATPQNSEVLLRSFRKDSDQRSLKLGTAGLASILTSVRADGASHGWFTWWPDRTGFDSRSLDTDMGLYAYLRAAAAYVAEDEVFGLVGYGCKLERMPDGALSVLPENGVDEAVYFGPDIEVVANCALSRVTLATDKRTIHIEAPVTSFGQQRFTVRGLPGGEPRVTCDRPTVVAYDGSGVVIDAEEAGGASGVGAIALTIAAGG